MRFLEVLQICGVGAIAPGFDVLPLEFEVDLLRMRSRERIPIARSHGAQGPQVDPAANTVRFQTHD